MNLSVITRDAGVNAPTPIPFEPISTYLNRPVRNYRGIPIAAGKTAFILPCHNEAADLPSALESIKTQTDASVDTILVVSDNSTDDTVAIARAAGVSVIETSGNRFKKAGALNLGIRHLMQSGTLPEFIITGDGDTEYDQAFVSRALNVMQSTPRLGVLSAVCYGKTDLATFPTWSGIRSGLQHLADTPRDLKWSLMSLPMLFVLMRHWLKAFMNYTLLWLQRAEYTRAANLRLRQNIHTMSGAGSMIRAEAIIDTLLSQASPAGIDWRTATLYGEHPANLVEDFALTLDIKREGWTCTNNFYVIAHTDLMRDFRSLFRQRTRWVRGTMDELRRRKFSPESRVSSLTIIYGLMMIPLFYIINGFVLKYVFFGTYGSILDFWFFPLMGLYQALMVKKMGWKSMIVAFILIPEMLYAVMRHTWIITSAIRSLFSSTQSWE